MATMVVFVCVIITLATLGYQVKGNILETQNSSGVIQGDIEFNPRQRNGVLKSERWPNGVIPYEIRSSYCKYSRYSTPTGTKKRACVRSRPALASDSYNAAMSQITFTLKTPTMGGSQRVSLTDNSQTNCLRHATIVHELLHAVGLYHEQMRYDRDQYIAVNYDNMRNGAEDNFKIIEQDASSTYGIPYNYESVMHYTAYAFSKNDGITMQPRDSAYTNIIGTARYGHELDWEKVRRIYDCTGSYTPAVTAPPPTEAPCADTLNYCDQLAKNDGCRTGSGMRSSCRKTCNFCNAGGPMNCKDKRDDCRQYRNKCGDNGMEWLFDYCEKTCELCH